nr:vegetative cell wall protein gp1-like [Setaria viridis]
MARRSRPASSAGLLAQLPPSRRRGTRRAAPAPARRFRPASAVILHTPLPPWFVSPSLPTPQGSARGSRPAPALHSRLGPPLPARCPPPCPTARLRAQPPAAKLLPSFLSRPRPHSLRPIPFLPSPLRTVFPQIPFLSVFLFPGAAAPAPSLRRRPRQ